MEADLNDPYSEIDMCLRAFTSVWAAARGASDDRIDQEAYDVLRDVAFGDFVTAWRTRDA